MLLQKRIKTGLGYPCYAASLFYIPLAEADQVVQVTLLCLIIGGFPEILNFGQSAGRIGWSDAFRGLFVIDYGPRPPDPNIYGQMCWKQCRFELSCR
jgi:hypothetical protein